MTVARWGSMHGIGKSFYWGAGREGYVALMKLVGARQGASALLNILAFIFIY